MKHFKCFIILLLFAACKEEPDYHFIPQLLLDYAYYEEGSCWVYQNDSTYEADSVYITSIKHYYDSIDADKRITDIYEVIEIEYESSKGVTYKAMLYARVLKYYFNNNEPHYLMTVTSENYIKESTNNYYIENFYDQISINSIIYNEGIETKSLKRRYYEDGLPFTTYYDTYWISKGNWIIKQHILIDDVVESWSLIKSKVIQ